MSQSPLDMTDESIPRSSSNPSLRTSSGNSRDLRKQRLQQQYAAASSASAAAIAAASAATAAVAQSVHTNNPDEWMNRIRQAAAANAGSMASSSAAASSVDKRSKKHKKHKRKKDGSSSGDHVNASDYETGEDEVPNEESDDNDELVGRNRTSSSRKSSRKKSSSRSESGHSHSKKKKSKKKSSKKSSSRSEASSVEGSDDERAGLGLGDLPDLTEEEQWALMQTTQKERSTTQSDDDDKDEIDLPMMSKARSLGSAPNLAGSSANTLTNSRTENNVGRGGVLQDYKEGRGRPPLRSNSVETDSKTNLPRTNNVQRSRHASFAFSGSSSGAVSQYLQSRSVTGSGAVSQYLQARSRGATGGMTSMIGGNSLDADGVPQMVMAGVESSGSDDENELAYGDHDHETEDENRSRTTQHDSSDESSEDEAKWSVRVCVVSAVDLPANVVPQVPASPVLKLSLLPLPPEDTRTLESGVGPETIMKRSIYMSGISSLPKSRVRCTNPKILSKRDNGSVEFHEEMRWDVSGSKDPARMVLALELSARAVMTPANIKESPPEPNSASSAGLASSLGTTRSASGSGLDSMAAGGTAGLKGFFRRTQVKKELETANAAAAVAKHLLDDDVSKAGTIATEAETRSISSRATATTNAASAFRNNELTVQLQPRRRRKYVRMTDDIRLGSQVVPLTKLNFRKAMKNNEAVRIEQWFELDMGTGNSASVGGSGSTPGGAARNPSVLLEISFSTPSVLDDSEDDLGEDDDGSGAANLKASFARRASLNIRNQLKKEVVPPPSVLTTTALKTLGAEPQLEPGIIDHICVLGPTNIGDQKSDDGASGWVHTTPELAVLEQFPPPGHYEKQEGNRRPPLPDKVEWFCFPEGCRLWRGTTPPNAEELQLRRFVAASPLLMQATTTMAASFDASLCCTSSFAWFVLSSNSDEYGSAKSKLFGACIRFFVPAPAGIDPTQDDFAQAALGGGGTSSQSSTPGGGTKRLWVPMAFCLTSQLPIVGAMEAMLLRICETLGSLSTVSAGERKSAWQDFLQNVSSLILQAQRPVPGIVNVSVPFMKGENLPIQLPGPNGLPRLPHGTAVSSVVRLLGAEGLVYLMAAMLTECKILLHSHEIANLSMVGEVLTALMYPFEWSLPYIPVLPGPMMEFIEAPLSYMLGVSTANFTRIHPEYLEDVVVVDLDYDFQHHTYDAEDEHGHRTSHSGAQTKTPTPLPASTAANLSQAVYRLLQADRDLEDEIYNQQAADASPFTGTRVFPRLQGETQTEREFRIAVAMEMAKLVRGYNDCLMVASSSQPMFNVDKFLQTAPCLFDEARGTHGTSGTSGKNSMRVLSPRARRFLAIFVNCQHFHQFLDSLEHESMHFLHEIMVELDHIRPENTSSVKRVLSLDTQKTIDQLHDVLYRLQDQIPVYAIQKYPALLNGSKAAPVSSLINFPLQVLQPILMPNTSSTGEGKEGVKSISLEYLVELEKNPWRYKKMLDVPIGEDIEIESVTLEDAMGERRYRAWKASRERTDVTDEALLSALEHSQASLDWGALLAEPDDQSSRVDASAADSTSETAEEAAKRRVVEAKERDLLRRCLDQARTAGKALPASQDMNTLLDKVEVALKSASARRFLLDILRKRTTLGEDQDSSQPGARRRGSTSGASKLEAGAFDILLRLGCAMLDACIETRDYDSAFSLLKLTAGLYSTVQKGDGLHSMLYMTQRLGHHPIYADLGVWEFAKNRHFNGFKNADDDERDLETDQYEAAVATLYEMLGYGIPAEELARFASRVSEDNGWFGSERGQSLLLLARRLSVRRDQGVGDGKTSDLEEMMKSSSHRKATESTNSGVKRDEPKEDKTEEWIETGWVHPSAQYSSRAGAATETQKRRMSAISQSLSVRRDSDLDPNRSNLMKRSAVTSMAYLGSSVVVSGGVDGGVFLARQVSKDEVRGLHLDWGSRYTGATTSHDGVYGVGAISVLAGTFPGHQSYQALQLTSAGGGKKGVSDKGVDEETLLAAMDGCRVVAGTTCGDLRVWSVKDVLSAVFYASRGNDTEDRPLVSDATRNSVVRGSRRAGTDFAAGSSLTRLKFSLRGRALSGHRGGVSCIDVPSNIYRPDSIITGGADGLIKLWSLRTPGAAATTPNRRNDSAVGNKAGQSAAENSRAKAARTSGDALSILSGHGGRILCVKTAWHGDRLLSGGADRTVRLWDLAGSGGKCLNSLSGHFGWVTAVQYWGPNTIISASTDRSVALWDARVRSTPLFSLRHHNASISDVLVGSRTDPVMISAGTDGSIAAWDFRRLSDSSPSQASSDAKKCVVVRRPAGKLYLHDFSSKRFTYGPVSLSRGASRSSKSVYCLGRDGIIREWDISSGDVLNEFATGHCDTVSQFTSLQGDKVYDSNFDASQVTGVVTTSWDGTVRVRKLKR